MYCATLGDISSIQFLFPDTKPALMTGDYPTEVETFLVTFGQPVLTLFAVRGCCSCRRHFDGLPHHQNGFDRDRPCCWSGTPWGAFRHGADRACWCRRRDHFHGNGPWCYFDISCAVGHLTDRTLNPPSRPRSDICERWIATPFGQTVGARAR